MCSLTVILKRVRWGPRAPLGHNDKHHRDPGCCRPSDCDSLTTTGRPQFLRVLNPLLQLLQHQTARRAGVIGIHLLLWTAAFQLALVLRFDGAVPPAIADACKITLLSLIAFRLMLFGYLRLFDGLWRYTGLPELQRLILASSVATVLAIALEAMVAPHSTPRSLYVGEWLASVVAVGGIRMLIRDRKSVV